MREAGGFFNGGGWPPTPVPDGVWRKAPQGQAVFQSASILRGYGSAHRPVLAQVRMKRLGAPQD